MAKKTLVYDDFSGGERGTFGDWRDDIPNSFRANNMLVFRDGRIGVRPGIRLTNPSGLSNGKVWGFGSTSITNADRWFAQGTAVYTFKGDGSNLQVAATALSATPTEALPYVQIAGAIYFTSYGDGTYKLQPNSSGVPVLTRLTSVSGHAIAAHGDRIVVGNISGSFVWRCRFTDALDYTSWPSENFFDVGDDGLGALFSQRNSLVIGAINGLFLLSGTPGVSAVLRKIATINGPAAQFDGIVGFLDQIYSGGLGMTAPFVYNGSTPIIKHNLDNGSWTVDSGGHPSPPAIGWGKLRARDEGVVNISQSNKGMVFMNGVWTFHSFGANVSGFMSTQGVDNIVVICDGGGSGVTPNFYNWYVTSQTPGLHGSGEMDSGDNSATSLTGTLTLPIKQMKSAQEVQVQEIIIDFTVFNTNGSNTNHIDAAVVAYNRRNSLGQISTVQSFDEAPAAATGDLSRRLIAYVGDQGPGNAFQVLLTNLRGVTITQITVIYDDEPFRGAK